MDDSPFQARPLWGPLPSAPPGHTWEALMDAALVLAREGEKKGEIPVGALLVDAEGFILSTAHNESIRRADPSGHAEILALRRAGERLGNYRLNGCFLVVTLEPCMMCAGCVREARLAGVVYGAADLRAGAVASVLDGLEGSGTWHMGGIRAQECSGLLRKFFNSRRPGELRGHGTGCDGQHN